MKKTGQVIRDIGGKRVISWVEDECGGRYVLDPETGSELSGLSGAVIIVLPPKKEKKKRGK